MKINLNTFLNSIGLDNKVDDIVITGLAIDSRQVKPGDLFFAISGCNHDGHQFIEEAILKGAVAVMCDSAGEPQTSYHGVPIIPVEKLKQRLGAIIARFYTLVDGTSKTYLEKMDFIGITGTNGKTSCMQLLTQALNLLQNKTSMIGTIGYGTPENLIPQELTTPDPLLLQNILHQFYLEDSKTVVMEASSHALDQDRVSDVPFSLGIFTNLSRDHLDYHHDMESYAKAKHRLFEKPTLNFGVFNLDDPVGLKWMKEFENKFSVCGYTCESQKDFSSIVSASNIELNGDGIDADVQTPWGDGKLKSQLIGQFNVSNLLAVISALGLLGYSFDEILNIMPKLQPVVGRMQLLGGGEEPLVVIDFSHTPDALEQALKALRHHCEGKLKVIVGCGGDRDSGKRSMVGEIAERLADVVIITNDNVRTENPVKITDAILAGCQHPEHIRVIHDRKQAINQGISESSPQDVILLAGKGHEQYQIIGDKKLPFDEVALVNEALTRRK